MNIVAAFHSAVARRLCALVLILFASAGCQSPTENPPSVQHRVRVHMQDSLHVPIATLPVEIHRGIPGNFDPSALQTGITNAAGDAAFDVVIPTTGGQFVIIAGDDSYGRLQVAANLLCRDTLVVVTFQMKSVPCNEERTDSLKVTDLCVYTGGRGISDSSHLYYRSGCTVPLTMNYTPIDDPFGFSVFVFDQNGTRIDGPSFVLQPSQSFQVRAVATSKDTGRVVRTMTIAGTGSGGATMTINIIAVISAVPCEGCPCTDTAITVTFPATQARPQAERAVQTISTMQNRGFCERRDRLIQGPANPQFKLLSQIKSVVLPGDMQQLQLQFMPDDVKQFRDSILVERHIPETNSTCTTKIFLVGGGCEPLCCIDSSSVAPTPDPNVYDTQLRLRVYQSVSGTVCFTNCGSCGTAVVNQMLGSKAGGFTATPQSISMTVGQRKCFTVNFDARDEIVWPDGHGKPAKIVHTVDMPIQDCKGPKTVRVNVAVDTIPILYSRCIYVWNDNGQLGFNFTPPELKGSEIYDADPVNGQITDLVVQSIVTGSSAVVRIRSGWKFIRANVSAVDFTFTTISTTWPNYRAITTGAFDASNPVTLDLGSVYSIRIERGGAFSYALIRVREISTDADGKRKICVDVLYPMIKEG